MENLILFMLGVIGFTHIMVDSTIMAPLREWIASKESWWWKKVSEILSCYQCAGTWCGFILGFLLFGLSPIMILISGFAGSFLAVLGSHLLAYLEAKTIISIGDDNGN